MRSGSSFTEPWRRGERDRPRQRSGSSPGSLIRTSTLESDDIRRAVRFTPLATVPFGFNREADRRLAVCAGWRPSPGAQRALGKYDSY